MGLTFDFRCDCGYYFELIGRCRPGQEEADCPRCAGIARREFNPGSWSVPGTGIFKPYFSVGLDRQIDSKRQLQEELKTVGASQSEERRYSKRSQPGPVNPTAAQIERALGDLRREDVERHREDRERSEQEESRIDLGSPAGTR